MIDTSTGRASFAYTGAPGWHGLGFHVDPSSTVAEWLAAAGLTWTAKRAFVRYATGKGDAPAMQCDTDNVVLFRSDTLKPLGIVGADYKVVQPSDIGELFRDLTEEHGFHVDTMGAIKDGRVIWALAKGEQSVTLAGGDTINDYLLCSTSFDGSKATDTRRTSVRVVCNNTLTMALAEAKRRAQRVSHRSRWDKGAARDFALNEFGQFADTIGKMSETQVEPEQAVSFLLSVYHGMTLDQAKEIERLAPTSAPAQSAQRSIAKTLERLSGIVAHAPGQNLKSAQNTLWGLVNAVTYDVDHVKAARSDENRLASSWFGQGETLKNQAFETARKLLGPRPLAVAGPIQPDEGDAQAIAVAAMADVENNGGSAFAALLN
jgi:phage/plasmid-like protein (TIGR03299 family)